MTAVILSLPRDPEPSLRQLLAVSAIIVSAEKIASRGLLAEQEETELRELIVRVCNVFGVDTIAERPIEIVA
ncbi:hypothetical protein [Bradyrhizobium sp. 62]|uniref:hypothetical protein n=1 Tax=Bradyrhizobium sp. 62 TaxID=1043588 RepID=UPI001FFABC6E|nr:hypothetical protein [Bradyrhizobium sp. 62]MCK1367660.1 hypothetical protein [Bradyrhizobium sp. 62]